MKSSTGVKSLLLSIVLVGGWCVVSLPNATYAQKPTPSEAPRNPLLGRWKSDEAVIEIRADGTITINDEKYIYKVKNAVITVSNDEGGLAFPYVLEGDTLTVDAQGREVVYTRLKGKAAETPAAGAGGDQSIMAALVGKWCYMANLTGTSSYMSTRCFVLYQNGTYEFSSETSSSGTYGSSVGQSYDSGRWTATRTTLTAYSNKNGKIVYPIELRNHPKNKNDPMIVVDGDAYVTATQRRPW